MDKLCGIYKLTSPTGKIYVGQSINIHRRKIRYKNLDCKHQRKLYNSLKKYGFDKHEFEILDLCLKNELNQKERFWQEHFNVIDNGLNCELTNDDNCKKKVSKETRLKLRNSRLGKKHTEESKLKMSKIQRKLRPKKIKVLKGIFTKKVICTKTKIIYNSIKECAEKNNIIPATLSKKLKGTRTNNTTFKYYKNEII